MLCELLLEGTRSIGDSVSLDGTLRNETINGVDECVYVEADN